MMRNARAAAFAVALLAIGGCNSESVSGTGGLVFDAALTGTPPQTVQVIAHINNVSSGPVDVQLECPSVTSIVHTGSITGPVVYDPRPVAQCSGVSPAILTLEYGRTLTILGTGIPTLASGTYYVEALIAVNGESVSVNAGTVTF